MQGSLLTIALFFFFHAYFNEREEKHFLNKQVIMHLDEFVCSILRLLMNLIH